MARENIVLTSNSFPDFNPRLRQEFLRVVGKPVEQIKVMFIPTASVKEEDREFMRDSRASYLEMGILPKNIIDVELDHYVTEVELSLYDVVHVDGGNTFYLLEKIRETGFDKAVKKYLKRNKGVYVGMSAGTIAAGPDIEIAIPFDDPAVGNLKDTKGMGLVPTAYSPHFQRKDIRHIQSYIDANKYPVKTLRDGEGIISDRVTERQILL